MAVLAGVPPEDAVAWVRQNYEEEAVEGDEQEQWVLWFAKEVECRGECGACTHDTSNYGERPSKIRCQHHEGTHTNQLNEVNDRCDPMISTSQFEMKPVLERFAESLRERFSSQIFTTEDSIRYTFFHCLVTTGGVLPWEVILEYPHPVIKGAKVDTYVSARNDRSALAFEFKFDRAIPSFTNQPRPQKAGSAFADIFRLALVPSDIRCRLYFVYVTDREMARYFQNPSNALQDFFNLAPDSDLTIDDGYVRRQSQTFVRMVGKIVDCQVTNQMRMEFGDEFWLRVYEVRRI